MVVSLSGMEHTRVVERLRRAGCVFAEDEAALLVATAGSPGQLRALVSRRVTGEPLEQVLGWAELCGVRVAVAPTVFVPRRRTELLATMAADLARPGDAVVELCCGTGAVTAVLAVRVPGLELHAADIDPAAVDCARLNLGRYGVAVHQGDLYAPLPAGLRGRVGLLVANAPYVPSGEIPLLPAEARDHEARRALDGGPDGLDVQRRIAEGLTDWLAADGLVLVETGARQVARSKALLSAVGLRTSVVRDDGLGATVVVGRRGRA